MRRIPVETTSGATLGRRSFVKLCASTAAVISASPHLLAQAARAPLRLYERVRLIDAGGKPLKATSLRAGDSLIFNYPYTTTPCFLLNLGKTITASVPLHTEAGAPYLWPGGVGTMQSLVAFSAICAHKMSHPAKAVSFINYRHEAVSFRNAKEQVVTRAGVILCCSENSAYDPARGASVLGGPAKQPLCSILLEHDSADDTLYALGSYGGEMFEPFFERFGPRLQIEWATSDVRRTASADVLAVPFDTYSRSQMMCGA
ncbi:MAG: arsenite oxidase small subunit [Gammaproteobacteria bacterium]|jgi:arsenite oxidase small subunit